MGKILCLIYENMADFEITFACHLLQFFGEREVLSVGIAKLPVKGLSGMTYKPVLSLDEALILDDVDALIIPGGWSEERDERILALIQKLNSAGKLLCAICSGPYYLAEAGVLEGKAFTTSLTADSLKTLGEENDPLSWDHFRETGVVCIENVITAQANAFIDFGVEIYDALGFFKDQDEKWTCAEHFKGR